MTTLCDRVIFGLDHGARCSEPAGHNGAHIYRSAWCPDKRHDDEPEGDHR